MPSWSSSQEFLFWMQNEKKQLQEHAQELAEEVSKAEAQRDALSCIVAHLDLRLRDTTLKLETHHEVREGPYTHL